MACPLRPPQGRALFCTMHGSAFFVTPADSISCGRPSASIISRVTAKPRPVVRGSMVCSWIEIIGPAASGTAAWPDDWSADLYCDWLRLSPRAEVLIIPAVGVGVPNGFLRFHVLVEGPLLRIGWRGLAESRVRIRGVAATISIPAPITPVFLR